MESVSKKKKVKAKFKPFPMKRVLIALDYDQSAQKVAEKGFSMAKNMNAEVILLHVVADATYYSVLEYSPITGYSGFNNLDFQQLANGEGLQKASQYFLEKIKLHLNDKTIKILLEDGNSAKAILKTAKKEQVDLIIMGSHSRRWLEKILLGSVAEKVLHKSRLPVTIIPIRERKS